MTPRLPPDVRARCEICGQHVQHTKLGVAPKHLTGKRHQTALKWRALKEYEKEIVRRLAAREGPMWRGKLRVAWKGAGCLPLTDPKGTDEQRSDEASFLWRLRSVFGPSGLSVLAPEWLGGGS